MILLRKKDHPLEIGDYWPISLIHSFGKLVTKCLAKRLAPMLDDLVMKNQSAFIRGRRIHDNFRQLACKAIDARRTPAVLLKIDIAKAFDTVSWTFLLDVLRHMGFRQRWRDWISAILSTSNTKILLNGRPGTRICHARGLWQGDPLSLCYLSLSWKYSIASCTGSKSSSSCHCCAASTVHGSVYTPTTSWSSSLPMHVIYGW
jgi:hypothetical protein